MCLTFKHKQSPSFEVNLIKTVATDNKKKSIIYIVINLKNVSN